MLQSEKSRATRQRLLDAAFECLVQYGYFGTTTVAVCHEAGVARGTMLHHFPNKESLVLASLEDILERRLQEFTETLDTLDTHDHEALLRALWQALKGPSFKAWLELALASRTQAELAQEFRDVMSRFDIRVHEIVQQKLPSKFGGLILAQDAVGLGFSALNGFALDLLQMDERDADNKVELLIQLTTHALKSFQPS